MPSPKDVLFANGRIDKIGRGRISADNHKWLADFVAKGGKVDGYESGTKQNLDGTQRLVNTKPTVATEKVVGELFYRYSEDRHEAVEVGTGKVRSMREVCQPCGFSLLGHGCDRPVIVSNDAKGGGIRVEIRNKR